MSANGTRVIIWEGGEDTFCLAKVGLIFELEERCKAGISAIQMRIETGQWGLNDIREPIRLGLIGGGMAPDKAMLAVKRHLDGKPLASNVLLAYEIIKAVLVGVPDDPVGKKDDDEGKAPPAEAGTSSSTMTDVSEDLS
jgi:hypothetical protein